MNQHSFISILPQDEPLRTWHADNWGRENVWSWEDEVPCGRGSSDMVNGAEGMNDENVLQHLELHSVLGAKSHRY